ncbi:MAG: hypothetical protein ACRET8_07735 [Burkholderiales bacterium]
MEGTRKSSSSLQGSLDDTVERVVSGAHDAVDKVAGAANSASRQIGRKGDELLKVKDRYLDQATGQLRDHPLAALGTAVLAGFLLTILLTRR